MSRRFFVPLFLFLVAAMGSHAQQSAWVEAHGIKGHHLSSVLHRNQTIWVGTRAGGLFRSSGDLFVPSRQGLPVGHVASIEMDAAGTMYVGVEEGTYRSTDAGRSWQRLAEVDGVMTGLTSAGRYVFLSSGGGLYRAAIDSGVFSRIDDPVLESGYISSLASTGSLILAGTSIAVFRSSDLGASWAHVPVAHPDSFPFASGVTSLAISPAGITAVIYQLFLSVDSGLSYLPLPRLAAPRVYAMISDVDRVIAATENGVTASTDGGRTFVSLLATGSQPVLDVARDGNTLVAITGRDIYISSDRGIGWTMRTPEIEAYPVTDVTSMGDGDVYALADSALFRSTDMGRNFVRASADTTRLGLRDIQIGSGGLFALAGPFTILRSRDAGSSWTDMNVIDPDTGYPIAVMHIDGPTVIAATHFYGIYYSTDNGDSWSVARDDTPGRILDNPRAFASWRNEIYLATRDLLLRSTDRGATWISEGTFGGLDRSIVTLGSDGYHLYAATSQDVYVRSLNDDQWQKAGDLPGVRSIVVAPWTVYAGTGRNGVWMTWHGAPLWQRVDDMGGPAADINDLAIAGDRLVAATGSNVWTSHVELGDAVRDDAELPRSLHARYDAGDGMLHLTLSIDRPADLDIDLVDMRGAIIRELVDDRLTGSVTRRFAIDPLPAGLYFMSVRSAHGMTGVPVMITGER